jgi:hypothetical protein
VSFEIFRLLAELAALLIPLALIRIIVVRARRRDRALRMKGFGMKGLGMKELGMKERLD